jgi:hypothetical protein
MNYIVTDKHKYLKAGLILFQDPCNAAVYRMPNYAFCMNRDIIEQWKAEGWIAEQQQPEFTRDDMIEFGKYRLNIGWYNNTTDIFDEWLSKRNETIQP